MTDPSAPRLLVTGASGHLGRRVVELLLGAGVSDVTAASRQPDKIIDLAARGAPLRRADFDDPASLDEAFASVDRLLLISTDALGTPGQWHARAPCGTGRGDGAKLAGGPGRCRE
ncbi:NAD(P)H-binding protein [Pseudomonas syringae]|uniref:NAD(P)H-binding protein n=1 Tax=Pseudomonas syringae TaxID=317 RepID=UPI000BB5C59E|nr:hypothetical protein CCL23_00605 [Pseudomonas syringae]